MMDTVEVQIRVEKNEEGSIRVFYGMFDVNSDVMLDITPYIGAEELISLTEEIRDLDWFMTRTQFDILTYIQMSTSLFEVYNEKIEELEAQSI